MEELALQQPELIGREEELNKLKQSLDNAIAGKGSIIFISGEAGIGKTRLVSELIKEAETKDAQVIQGWCLAESLEPLMPIKTALREAGLFHLISGDPPPQIVSSYLMGDSGILIAKSEREELDLDPHIFASMLTAVGNFVKDSMGMVDRTEMTGGLNNLGYKEFNILIEEYRGLHLATVTKGSLSEFLAHDMRDTLAEIQRTFGNILADWDGDLDKVSGIENIVSRLITSGKYDGRFLVDDPKIRQENLFDNILLGLQRMSVDRPILLFLDDLQWVDPSTLNLIHYLARNTKQNNVMILGTYRPEDIVRSHDGKIHHLESAMQNMRRDDLLDRIELGRLGAEDTKHIICSTLGLNNFDDEFFDKVYKETEGTPFFVLEVAKLLVEEGAISKDETGIWELTTNIEKLDIPSKVYDVIKRRLDRLMREQRDILECASIVGEEFRSELIGKTIGINKIQLLKNLSEIEKVHNLIHYLKDKYRFDHAKIKEVLYNGIGGELRKEYHRIIADTILEINKDDIDNAISELAYHYYEAKDEWAAKYLIMAGEKALKEYGIEESTRIFNRALEVAKNPCELIQAHIGIIDICRYLGKTDTILDNINKAKKHLSQCKDEGLKIKLMLKEIMQKRHMGEEDDEEATKRYNKIIEACKKSGNEQELAKAYSYLAASNFASCNYSASLNIMKKKLEIDERLGNKEDIVHTYYRIGWILFRTGDLKGAFENLGKSLSISEEMNYKNGLVSCYDTMARIAEEIKGDYNEAIRLQEKMIQIWKELGREVEIIYINYAKGKIATLKGNFIEAIGFYKKYIKSSSELNDHYGVAGGYYHIGEIHMKNGELDEALAYFERTLQERKNIIKNQVLVGHALNYIGRIYLLKGDGKTALDYFNQSIEIFKKVKNKAGISYTQIKIAEANLLINKIKQAETSAKKALEISSEIGANVEEGMSLRALGMVHREKEDWKNAISEFKKAESILENADRIEYAVALYEFGLLWKAKGEPDKAKEHLEKALAEFERMYMKLWADKTQKALEELN